MYERFTDPARSAMKLAQSEAKRFHHVQLGTEHILLGLLKDGTGVAARVFGELEVDFGQVCKTVEQLVQTGPDVPSQSRLPATPHARKAIECAMEEARKTDAACIDSGHMLLGLMRVREGLGAKVLSRLGVKDDQIRAGVNRQTEREPLTSGPDQESHGTFILVAMSLAAAILLASGLALWALSR